MKILKSTKLDYFIHKPNHGSKVNWVFHPGLKISVSVGVLGAVGVISVVKLKKYLELDSSSQQLAPPRFWAVPGLENLGNNCFLNVILQALSSGSSFRKYLWDMVEEYGCVSDENMMLVNSLASLVEELCTVRHRRTVLSPRKVMLAVDHYIPNFNLTREQDAEEAFSHLLSSLREEMSEQFVPNKSHLVDVLAITNGKIVITKDSGDESDLERWRRCFLGPFDGILGSIIICHSCSFQISLDFQLFHSLHLSPPFHGDGTIIAGCTLEDCFKRFFVAEHLKNYCCSHCWHTAAIEYVSTFNRDSLHKIDIEKLQNCNKNDPCDCKSLPSLDAFPWSNNFSRTFKQMSIARSPKILCIHLQRASYMFGQSTKLLGHISFPYILDLSSFMNTEVGIKNMEANSQFGRLNRGSHVLRSFPYPKHQNMKHDPTMFGCQVSTVKNISEAQTLQEHERNVNMNAILPSAPIRHQKYRLISVVEHFGNGGTGHYTVYRRVTAKIGDENEDPASLLESSMEQWFFISDSEVHSVSEKDVLDAKASMLFYERINEP